MSTGSAAPVFTVFTATFDRAHTLHRVHDSLLAQTLRDFEWIVVDDGSTDATADLVRSWSATAPFPVRYRRQERSGKHVAFNRAVREARGGLFVTVDSDDACAPHALARLHEVWTAIPADRRDAFCGVTALCEDQHGRLVGDPFPRDPTDSDALEIRYRHRVRGDKWGFQRTDLLRSHPFPELPDQAFVTESVVWHRLARTHRTRYVNERLYVYHLEPEEDSLTKRVPDAAARAPMFAMSNRQALEEDLDWFRWAPWAFTRAAANLTRYSLHSGAGWGRPRPGRPAARALHAATIPVGVALWARDRRRAGRGPLSARSG